MEETKEVEEIEATEGEQVIESSPAKAITPLFPHEEPSEHWDADFGDAEQVYEGTALPLWLLAGWAIFIIWAIVYLFSGLPTAF